MRILLRLTLPVLALCQLAYCTPPATRLRGLDPDLSSRYVAKSGTFTCIDESKTAPFASVNDNYCDCLDGSDEPGTSACVNGKFYCANRGHNPTRLASSFVDDGVCDCCDGSDEAAGACRNTCLDKSRAKREELLKTLDLMDQALQAKERMLHEVVAQKAAWQERLKTIDSDVDAKMAEYNAAYDHKLKMNEEDRERVRIAEAAALAEEEEAARQQVEQDADGAETAAAAAAGAEAGAGAVEKQEEAGHEETEEERGMRIAAQWTHDPEAVGGAEQTAPPPSPPTGQKYPPRLHPDLEAAQNRLSWAEKVATDVRKERYDLLKFTSTEAPIDYGPNDMYLTLAGRCMQDFTTRFTYEVCFFDTATQVEPGAHTKNLLGGWHGFNEDYTKAYFKNGKSCTPDLERSMELTFVCGDFEELYGASEPSTCKYEIMFKSPMACTQEERGRLQAEVDQLDAFETEVQAEIDAHEAELRAAGINVAKDEL